MLLFNWKTVGNFLNIEIIKILITALNLAYFWNTYMNWYIKLYVEVHVFNWKNVCNFFNNCSIEILINARNLAYFCEYVHELVY